MNSQKEFDIFLSYNWSSKVIAQSFYTKLSKEHKLKLWMDDSQLDNRSLYEQLCDGINKSKLFLCLITKKYTESDNCIKEINFASLNKMPLIVVMLENLNISHIGSVGFIIAPVIRFNFYEEDQLFSCKAFNSMIKSIKANLSSEADNKLKAETIVKMPVKLPEGTEKNEVILANGDKFVGSFQNGKPHGYGVYIYSEGERYEGEFQANKKHGHGTYFYLSGDIYEGYWNDDNKNGKGTLTYKSGAKYVGDYVVNRKHGKGTYYYRNGDVYEGMWRDDKQTGLGKLIFKNGETYEGDFLNDEMHGFGIYTYYDGTKYEGMWQDGCKKGKGAIIYTDGAKVEKEF